MSNPAVILIEFQNEWLSETGRLYGRLEPDYLPSALSNAREVLEYARGQNFHIIHCGMFFLNPDTQGSQELLLRDSA
ncbi:hypothetical protein [Bifidobacterium aquikefiricola]|uniref:Isochorismatase n=1 Tax=Bifidobacterium aquikefiricola TaxID=3059038 RepID=A0AB39U9H5_9BIFI